MNMRSILSFSNYIKKFNTRLIKVGVKYDEKFKGTIIGNWIRYWKNVYIDYREVAIDLKNECKQKPWKAVGYLSTGAMLLAFAKTNPNEYSFRNSLLIATNELILVNPSLLKPSSLEHLKLLETCYNRNMIRRTNFLLFSVMWVDNDSCHCNKYDCQCNYLEVSYMQFFKRIVDVGFINRWWILDKKIEDYDVNY